MYVIVKVIYLFLLYSCGTAINDKMDSYEQASSSDIGTVSAAGEGLAISATDSLEGTTVLISPGSLAIGTSVSISTAANIVDSSSAGALGIDDLSVAGPSVLLESSGSSLAINPMSIVLPLSPSLGLSKGNIIVIYKALDSSSSLLSDEELYLGVIPSSKLRISSSSVRFQTRRFGAYQLAYTKAVIEEVIEVTTPDPIAKTTVRNDNLFIGLWGDVCEEQYNNYSSSLKVLINEDGSYIETFDLFDKPNCNASAIISTQMIRGRIEVGTEHSDGSLDADIFPEKFYMTFRNSSRLDEANRSSYCGKNNWKLHAFEDVTGSSCLDTSDTLAFYQRVLATSDRLYIGDDGGNNPTSRSQRPQSIDKSRYFTRQ